MSDLESRVRAIEERNFRVEKEKAWELSRTRVFTIVLLTYLVVGIFLMALQVPRPFINALVPAIGFFLSVQTLPIIKRWWMG